ncbi:hypothetical protein P3X46_012274 [Hevea brasiliensis]|uniref:UBC core domain-containing protein n=1 Tax=Hevea brasiliensis TaxID=3981 RepID=A0ABQ9M9P3_HEVBR|nr:putative ubiquitin-conjugating enzyme E2 38 isoform X2 [Hevea brasiliensis]XP_058006075.1 putative ubiquitin-conjugating enzyme E2 38 isoform X2 [Hevea brasiliensis]KAJ9177018.1 hypothetical protein P3X46_012274 [Hevea brasiliensis]KAJ9177019.1 hypothetical protein P3X46_012274 [Hevea brasiliensis]
MDVDMDDQVSISKKLKHDEVLCDVMDVESVLEPSEVLIGHEKADACSKGKSKVGYDDTWPHHIKDASSCNPGISTSVAGSVDSVDHLKSSNSGSININNINSSNSDLSYHDDEICDDGGDYVDDNSDYDANDDYLYEDDYLAIQSQFDNVDLPPGIEASLPWLKDPAPSGIVTSGTSNSTIADLFESKGKDAASGIAETKRTLITSSCSGNRSPAEATSSSAVTAESSSNGEVIDNEENGIIRKFKNFKQFDTVEDFSDHHYSRMGFSGQQPKSWAKRIQEEWKILEKDLPDTISVRVYEARMELLRAVIIGPAGTPYHDGLFVFDCLFPPNYPDTPPMVYYYSGGLRLNPNLYECGKVCLSLLGTWSGKQNEMWIPGTSTMLQVLVSIQALILNAKPFFNEPGYESSYVGVEGDRRSRKYNEDVFILSLKTMMYTLRRPPKYFEDYVIGHFHMRACDILVACRAYMDGATVGSVAVKDGVADIDNADRSASSEFKVTLRKMVNVLITTFTRLGSIECEQFRIND